MAKWYFDTSVIVAAAIGGHGHYAAASSVMEEMLSAGHRAYMSTHSLTEVYSVMTRTPFKPPIHPAEAQRLIEDQALRHMKLVALDESEHIEVVRRAAQEGWIEGRIHDGIHLQCAAKMKCDRIYTFNLRDFRAIAAKQLTDRIAVP